MHWTDSRYSCAMCKRAIVLDFFRRSTSTFILYGASLRHKSHGDWAGEVSKENEMSLNHLQCRRRLGTQLRFNQDAFTGSGSCSWCFQIVFHLGMWIVCCTREDLSENIAIKEASSESVKDGLRIYLDVRCGWKWACNRVECCKKEYPNAFVNWKLLHF